MKRSVGIGVCRSSWDQAPPALARAPKFSYRYVDESLEAWVRQLSTSRPPSRRAFCNGFGRGESLESRLLDNQRAAYQVRTSRSPIGHTYLLILMFGPLLPAL